MKIDTIAEWNSASCCSCDFPSCPTPRKQCESKSGTASVSGRAGVKPQQGPPTDDITNIFETSESVGNEVYDGDRSTLISGYYSGGGYDFEGLQHETFIQWRDQFGDDPAHYSISENYNTYYNEECESSNSSGVGPRPTGPYDVQYTPASQSETCTETQHLLETISVSSSGTLGQLQGCPGPFPEKDEDYWDYTKTETAGIKLSDPKNKSELIADATADAPSGWPTPPQGTACSAKSSTTWPKIADIGAWPACSENNPPSASASATVVKVRYRVAPPANYSTTEAPRSTWQDQWDDVSASKPWWEWFDSDQTGPEPSPGPTFIASREYIWDGNMEDPWSEWFELDPPANDGEIRQVNGQVICWRSSKVGTKPTPYGDQVVLPEP